VVEIVVGVDQEILAIEGKGSGFNFDLVVVVVVVVVLIDSNAGRVLQDVAVFQRNRCGLCRLDVRRARINRRGQLGRLFGSGLPRLGGLGGRSRRDVGRIGRVGGSGGLLGARFSDGGGRVGNGWDLRDQGVDGLGRSVLLVRDRDEVLRLRFRLRRRVGGIDQLGNDLFLFVENRGKHGLLLAPALLLLTRSSGSRRLGAGRRGLGWAMMRAHHGLVIFGNGGKFVKEVVQEGFLCVNVGKEVKEVKGALGVGMRQEFFLCEMFNEPIAKDQLFGVLGGEVRLLDLGSADGNIDRGVRHGRFSRVTVISLGGVGYRRTGRKRINFYVKISNIGCILVSGSGPTGFLISHSFPDM